MGLRFGVGVQDLGFMVNGLWLMVYGSAIGFRIQGLWSRAKALGFRVSI